MRELEARINALIDATWQAKIRQHNADMKPVIYGLRNRGTSMSGDYKMHEFPAKLRAGGLDMTEEEIRKQFDLDPHSPIVPLMCRVCGCAVPGTADATRLHVAWHGAGDAS